MLNGAWIRRMGIFGLAFANWNLRQSIIKLDLMIKNEDHALMSNIELVNEFSQKNIDRRVSLLLVPTSVELHQDKLPLYAEVASQKAVLRKVENHLTRNVKFMHVYPSLLAHKDEAIYFKTDHHWTMRGAYYAYEEVAKVLGFEPYSLADFSTKNVSANFLGTYASKVVGFPVQPDTIEVFQPRFPSQMQ